MTIYLLALTALMVGAIAPSFSAPDSFSRATRPLVTIAFYPLFVVMALTHGLKLAALTWLSIAALALLIELFAETRMVPADRSSLLRTLRNVLIAWPLTIPSTLNYELIQRGLAPPPLEVTLPDPPRGDALVALTDDEMLSAAHEILSGAAILTAEESTILTAESFNRDVHFDGYEQWASSADNSVTDTSRALRAVGARRAADVLEDQAKPAAPAVGDFLFALERDEDLTALIGAYLRKNIARCPALQSRGASL